MHIGLRTDLDGQRVWHQWLAADLARLGHSLVILRPPNASVVSLPASLQLALWLDPILFKLKGSHAFDRSEAYGIPDEARGQKFDDRTFDFVIDITSDDQSRHQAREYMRLLFNEQPSELAAIHSVLGAQNCVVSIYHSNGGQYERARPGIERRECLSCALDNIFSSVVELLVERISAKRTPEHERPSSEKQNARRVALSGPRYLTKTVATKVINKVSSYLDRSTCARSSWGLGVRRCADGDGLLEGTWPRKATFDLVPDDNLRYFADPFIFTRGGKTHVFVEELPMATGRGIISVAEVDKHGGIGKFRPVLERGFHLSYPFIFEYENNVWMLPEACESGSVDLYRAVDYPNEWVFDRRLLDGVPGCDATILAVGGKYFMTLTATRWLGTTWDKQRMYYADTPLGPWTEVDGGLVHIDCANARPAGAPISVGGRILRPTQDCSRGYGGSMNILEVQQLSRSACREIPVAKIQPAPVAGDFCTHTYSRNHSFEVVDVCGPFGQAQQFTLECVPFAR